MIWCVQQFWFDGIRSLSTWVSVVFYVGFFFSHFFLFSSYSHSFLSPFYSYFLSPSYSHFFYSLLTRTLYPLLTLSLTIVWHRVRDLFAFFSYSHSIFTLFPPVLYSYPPLARILPLFLSHFFSIWHDPRMIRALVHSKLICTIINRICNELPV